MLKLLYNLIFSIGPFLVVIVILLAYLRKKKKNNNQPLDKYGVASLILSVIFSPAGLIIGVIGVKKAIKEKRDPGLSKIGWILSLILLIITLITIPILFLLLYGINHSNYSG